ncbi:MAG TPA: EAL domain-containing protein [Solirubrobacteraceae bacterium]|jgi:PAS domain S-box-containing protein|nr:EAL domain-containing protein [Solirubrobacteraceae bacterium]
MSVTDISPAGRDAGPTVGLGSWELAVDGGVLTYSSGFAAALGLGLAADDTFTLADWEDLIVKEDRAAFRAAFDACLRTGSGDSEHRIARGDGAVRVVLARCDADGINAAGERSLRGAVVDITALREGERRRRAATSLFEQGFDAAPIAMSLSDPQTGRYLRTNDALCAMLGRSREQLAELSVHDTTHPDDHEPTAAAVRALVQEGAAQYRMEKRYLRSDGSNVWAEVHLAAVKDAEGRIEALYAQKIDITERKEREVAQAGLVRDAEWLSRIRDALDEGRMTLYWQPIVDLRSGEVVQRELLLRMVSTAGEVISPNDFLPIAERYGLMPEIDHWVIREATRLAAESGPTEFNLSAASIGDPTVLAELASAIEATGVNPADLVIEVTETAVMSRPEAGHLFAEWIRDLGCGLALDDFGTGFSSLKYLKELPAGHLKIDIEFVRDLADNETDQRLVRGIVGLAAEFHQTTTAEGIEDERTRSKLLEFGVVRGQGYLFGHPRPIENSPCRFRVASAVGHGCPDPVQTVAAAFRAFEERDVASAQALCHPDFVLRPLCSPRVVEPYRGPEAIPRYYRDVEATCDELRLHPSAYWTSESSVVAFGRVIATAPGHPHTTNAMWVFGFRDGLIVSVDVFEQPRVGGIGHPLSIARPTERETHCVLVTSSGSPVAFDSSACSLTFDSHSTHSPR